jgi:hypothetical protein
MRVNQKYTRIVEIVGVADNVYNLAEHRVEVEERRDGVSDFSDGFQQPGLALQGGWIELHRLSPSAFDLSAYSA